MSGTANPAHEQNKAPERAEIEKEMFNISELITALQNTNERLNRALRQLQQTEVILQNIQEDYNFLIEELKGETEND